MESPTSRNRFRHDRKILLTSPDDVQECNHRGAVAFPHPPSSCLFWQRVLSETRRSDDTELRSSRAKVARAMSLQRENQTVVFSRVQSSDTRGRRTLGYARYLYTSERKRGRDCCCFLSVRLSTLGWHFVTVEFLRSRAAASLFTC